MASDDKSTPTPKSEPKPASTEKAAATPSSSYGGEGQKPASQAYKDNWNAIFAKKKRK